MLDPEPPWIGKELVLLSPFSTVTIIGMKHVFLSSTLSFIISS